MNKLVLALGTAIMISAPANGQTTPARQFDLECAGNSKIATASGSTEGSFTRRLRIDLDKEIYCVGDCVELRKIAAISDQGLVLADDISDDQKSRERTEYLFANRLYRSLFMLKPIYRTAEMGQCQVLDFSGFPDTAQLAG